MPSLVIEVPRGFAFEAAVTSHGWYRLAPFRWIQASRMLGRTESIPPLGAIDLRIRFDKSLIVESDSPLETVEQSLRSRLSRMFQLGLDLREFHSLCRASATHKIVAARRFGRLLCGSTRWEDAVKIIATTNTTWRQTVRMVELITEEYGSRSKSGTAAFPSPERIAAATPAELAAKCRLGYRSRYVSELARLVASRELDLDALSDRSLDGPTQLRRYQQMPGIGPYGAAHLMAMEGRHDFIAIDTEFRRFVRERYHRGRKVSDAALLRRYARWGSWRYLAYWSELWFEVETKV